MTLTDDGDGDGELYHRTFWQQVNQDNALAGRPPLMPEDWAAAEAMDEAACQNFRMTVIR